MIEEQHTVQMVHLVLQADGEKPVGLQRLLRAMLVEIFGLDGFGAFHIVPDFGHRQAALFHHFGLVRGPGDDGIDEDARVLASVALVDIHHQHALGHADLDGGQADAVGVIHGLDHVGDQRADFRIDRRDRLGHRFEARIGRGKDGANAHVREIGERPRRVKIRLTPRHGFILDFAGFRHSCRGRDRRLRGAAEPPGAGRIGAARPAPRHAARPPRARSPAASSRPWRPRPSFRRRSANGSTR